MKPILAVWNRTKLPYRTFIIYVFKLAKPSQANHLIPRRAPQRVVDFQSIHPYFHIYQPTSPHLVHPPPLRPHQLSKMTEATPRINAPYLESFAGQTVRILGKVVSLRGDTATIDAGGSVTILLNRVSCLFFLGFGDRVRWVGGERGCWGRVENSGGRGGQGLN